MIDLIIIPGLEVKTFIDFCQNYGKNAIALDGFVKAPPQRSFKYRCINWNHHDGVSRSDTYATCAQALTGIRQQAMLMFKQNNEINIKVYANDCDEDVCLAWAVIHNYYLFNSPFNPLLNRLVEIENRLDSSMGIYAYGVDMPMLKTLEWVYEPYRNFVKSGGKERGLANEYYVVVEAVVNRINKYLMGQGEQLSLNNSYVVVKDMIVENYRIAQINPNGSLAKMMAYTDGVHIGLTIKNNLQGNKNVTIWSSTPYMPCDTRKLSRRFNQLEKPTQGTWGGGDGICASPRIVGTALTEDIIWQELVKNVKHNLS